MARPVDPPDANAPAPPPAPADLLPDLQAKIELATRSLAILERRIAAWESELTEVKKELRERSGKAEPVEAPRFEDLEARITRLERRQLRQQARDAASEALAKAASGAGVAAIGLGLDDLPTKAVVFARWSSNEVRAGEVVKLSALVDGFGPDEEITFTITALDGSRVGEPLVGKSGGKDMAEVKWKAPPPAGRPSAEYYFEATGAGQVARSPVLTVTKG
jgi:chaperonin cofactor prefoldin